MRTVDMWSRWGHGVNHLSFLGDPAIPSFNLYHLGLSAWYLPMIAIIITNSRNIWHLYHPAHNDGSLPHRIVLGQRSTHCSFNPQAQTRPRCCPLHWSRRSRSRFAWSEQNYPWSGANGVRWPQHPHTSAWKKCLGIFLVSNKIVKKTFIRSHLKQSNSTRIQRWIPVQWGWGLRYRRYSCAILSVLPGESALFFCCISDFLGHISLIHACFMCFVGKTMEDCHRIKQ